MQKIFGEKGCLSSIHSGFEFRQEQLQMAEFILENLICKKNSLIEAGTGIGKTLAYLVPTIIYSLENEKIIAVSTETKALQKQLIDKDIPLAKEAIKIHLDKEIKSSLCLGSHNYSISSCLRAWAIPIRPGFACCSMPPSRRCKI
ncbi:MAG: DEAD/DEAH box helicase [Spirochaetota bacterium]|nr:DEAD/DEAH box helicase [Spirochaetota bacterium]